MPAVRGSADERELHLAMSFDAATPEPYRSRIEGYKARCPQFEAVYYTAAQAANLTENLRTTITAYVSCDRKGRKSPPEAADHH